MVPGQSPKTDRGADVVRLLHELVAFVAGEHTGGGADGRYFVAVSPLLLHFDRQTIECIEKKMHRKTLIKR